jgi:hypothetical protein
MPFTKEDFSDPDVFERLRALSMVRTGNKLQTRFENLTIKQQRFANEWLNTYIFQKLDCDNWMDILLSDFQNLCEEELFDPNLSAKNDYTNVFVRQASSEPVLLDKETDIRDTEYK